MSVFCRPDEDRRRVGGEKRSMVVVVLLTSIVNHFWGSTVRGYVMGVWGDSIRDITRDAIPPRQGPGRPVTPSILNLGPSDRNPVTRDGAPAKDVGTVDGGRFHRSDRNRKS